MAAHATDVGRDNFEMEVMAASREVPVVIDFWAPWCAPCRQLKPVLEKLAAEFNGRFKLAKINSDENPELSAQFGVRGIPAVKAVVDGQVVNEFTGALPESAVRDWLETIMPSPAEPLRREGLALVAQGRLDEALAVLAQASELDPGSEAICLDRVDTLIALGRTTEASTLLESVGPLPRDEARVTQLQAKLSFAGTAGGDLDASTLNTRLADNPDDHAARLEMGTLLAAQQRYEDALDALLQVVSFDRGLRDEARQKILQIFALLPADSDLVRNARRRLAAALN